MKLGLDAYTIRSQGWDVFQQIDYCQRVGFQLLQTGIKAIPDLGSPALAKVRAFAQERDVELELAMGCISPTTATFAEINTSTGLPIDPTMSKAEVVVDHLQQMLLIAAALGSRSLHTFVGHKADREMSVPVAAHIESTIASCRAVRAQALDLGVIIAIENHAGDLTGRELRDLIETAGSDFVGACFDSGGTMAACAEAPMVTLGYIAPYVVQSHLRDSALWQHPRGAVLQHVNMGKGSTNIREWAAFFKQNCPRSAFTLENLTGFPPRVMNTLEPEFWAPYPDTLAADYAQFERLVRQGHPYEGTMITVGRGESVPPEYEAALVVQQLYDVEKSARFCVDELGIGKMS